jgi:hypothetical protein
MPESFSDLGKGLGHMKHTYRLIKLKTETVRELKELMSETGAPGIDSLVCSMIKLIRAERERFKDEGWNDLWPRGDSR